ncbi:hypothetical protein [Paludifilum halophilum]|uniref:Uncharacterized protein n=1 Tax=Paludifilum halophilum TaxID=1642702 RepID=A0A235B9K4_9BACL|nr:hypothetical protein [Paludifilum halophilum]OYD08941.1 hypothetical protein CHM34_03955 [Paludifilum halophilum]
MLVAPEDYRRFADGVKRVVLLEVLEKALERDRVCLNRFPFRMRRALVPLFESASDWVFRELGEQRRVLRQIGGEIIEVSQLEDCRKVRARFRGFLYTHRYMNGWLRSECEDLLLSHWGVKRRPKEADSCKYHGK